MTKQKPCKFCKRYVPANCTGEIQDHCTWCGGPASTVDIAPDGGRFCRDKCVEENAKCDREGFGFIEPLKPGDTLKAVVFLIQPFGIFLRDVNHPKIDILVEIDIFAEATKDYTQVGAVLEIKIYYLNDGAALATIVGD